VLAAPSFRDSIEQAIAAAAVVAEPSERISLLDAVTAALQEPARAGGWASALRLRALTDLAAERQIEKAYSDLSSSMSASSAARARRGDVPGVQALVQAVLKADDRLGRRRPQETSALLQLLDFRLDEARRTRLARDAWIVRSESYRDYRAAIAPALAEFRTSSSLLESIRQLAGPEPAFAAAAGTAAYHGASAARGDHASSRPSACARPSNFYVSDGEARRVGAPERDIIRRHVARVGSVFGCGRRGPDVSKRG
jgi:hypothetical protein